MWGPPLRVLASLPLIKRMGLHSTAEVRFPLILVLAQNKSTQARAPQGHLFFYHKSQDNATSPLTEEKLTKRSLEAGG